MRKIVRDSRFWLVLILLFAAALRFYNLSGYLQFLGDQGRDVLIVKAMIVNQKWTLLGPSASVGGFFTGPIYYYFMLPFLWLFRLDPTGPAYMAALFGLATIALIYWTAREFDSKRAGLVAALLATLSPKMIDISRFSWNPNPVPFFALLSVVWLYLAAVRQRYRYTLLAGIAFGILFQLHYITLAFGIVLGVAMVLIFPVRSWPKHFILAGLGFLLGNSLFLVFEIRHNFPNLRSILEFISRDGKTVSPRSSNFLWLVWEMLRRLHGMLFGVRDTIWEQVIMWASLAGLGTWLIRSGKSPNFRVKAVLIGAWLILGTIGIGSYQGNLNDHYFNYLYPLPFLLLGFFGSWLMARKWTWSLFIIGLSAVSYPLITNFYFWQPPQNMLSQIQDIDQTILTYAGNQPYNLGLISGFNTDQAYRYYLELWNRPPVTIENPQIDPQRKTVTSTLVVICEEKKCEPLGNPRWEIAGFGQAEIADQKMGPAGIRIFKLVHYKGT